MELITSENRTVEYNVTDDIKNKIVNRILTTVKNTDIIDGWDLYDACGPDLLADLLGEIFDEFQFKIK